MEFKILNETEAKKIAESTTAYYGDSYEVSKLAERAAETVGEGTSLNLALLESFVGPLQKEWESRKERQDTSWGTARRAEHSLPPKSAEKNAASTICGRYEKHLTSYLWKHCLEKLDYEESWLRTGDGVQTQQDRTESIFSAALDQILKECGVPQECRQSHGFWRYLTLKYFWWYVQWRANPRPGYAYKKYTDPKTGKHEQPILRASIRGRLCEDNGRYELAFLANKDTEFWQSAIIKRVTSYSKDHTHALANQQFTSGLSVGEYRKNIQGLVGQNRTNFFIHGLDKDDNQELFEYIYDQV